MSIAKGMQSLDRSVIERSCDLRIVKQMEHAEFALNILDCCARIFFTYQFHTVIVAHSLDCTTDISNPP
jgi:hypothetical protein